MEERCRFVLLAREPRANIAALCREFTVSRKTGYKWLKRFAQGGLSGLEERSRRPLSCNGSPFCAYLGLRGLSGLSVWWIKHGIHPNRIPPGSPQYNGGHERMHRDIKAELQKSPAKNLRLQQEIFDIWRTEFNTARPHRALKMATPSERYCVSERRYTQEIVPYDYGDGMQTRTVGKRGSIWWRGKERFVSNALSKEQIGIEIRDGMMLSLWFRDFYLGATDVDFTHPLGGG